MRILFEYYSPMGGMITLQNWRIKTLREVGIECVLMFRWPHVSSKEIDVRIPMHITDDEGDIQFLLNHYHFDLIVVTNDHAAVERFRRLGYSGPLLFEIMGLGDEATQAKLFPKFMPILLHHVDGVLRYKSDYLDTLFRKYDPQSQLPQYFVKHMFDSAFFGYRPAAVRPPKINARLRTGSGGPIMMWVGRADATQQPDYFLEICAKMRETIPSLRLWMFIDATVITDAEHNRLHQNVHRLGLSQHFTLFTNEPHHLMRDYLSVVKDSGGLLFSTTIAQAFGFAIMEAMSCEVCPLVTELEGVKAVLLPGETGLFIPQVRFNSERRLRSMETGQQPQSRQSMLADQERQRVVHRAAEIGLHVLGDVTLRAELGRKGREHIVQNFSFAEYARNFKNIARQVMRRKR